MLNFKRIYNFSHKCLLSPTYLPTSHLSLSLSLSLFLKDILHIYHLFLIVVVTLPLSHSYNTLHLSHLPYYISLIYYSFSSHTPCLTYYPQIQLRYTYDKHSLVVTKHALSLSLSYPITHRYISNLLFI